MEKETKKEQTIMALAIEIMILADEVEFKFIFISGNPKLFAIVEVYFHPLVFRGFRVMASSRKNIKTGDYINVVPPTLYDKQKFSGKSVWIVFLENLELWHMLSDKILEKYHEEKSKKHQQRQ